MDRFVYLSEKHTFHLPDQVHSIFNFVFFPLLFLLDLPPLGGCLHSTTLFPRRFG